MKASPTRKAFTPWLRGKQRTDHVFYGCRIASKLAPRDDGTPLSRWQLPQFLAQAQQLGSVFADDQDVNFG